MATYYVAPSGGSNGNSGLSTSLAWATVAYGVSNLVPGDVLILMDGTHTISAGITTFDSGTSGSYITIRSQTPYGATLQAGGDLTIFYGTGVSYVRCQELVFRGVGTMTVNALVRWSGGTGIQLVDCRTRNHTSHGLRFHSASASFLVDGGDYQHEAEESPAGGKDCIVADGSGTTGTIQNCSLHNNGDHSGIYVDTSAVVTVDNVDVYDTESHSIACENATITIRNCRLRTAGTNNQPAPVNYGIFLKGSGAATIYDNDIYSNTGGGVMLKDYTGAAVIYGNSFYGNNTAGGGSGSCLYYNSVAGSFGTVNFRNNIIHHSYNEYIHYFYYNGAAYPGSGLTFDRNLYYVTGAGVETFFWFTSGASYASLSAWRTARESANTIIGSDPLYYNAASGDLRLATGSPAINAGVVISPYTDGYYGAAPDMGAHEREPLSLAFASVPATGQTATVISTFTVTAAFFDGGADTAWSTNVVVALQSGPGAISGTTTRTPSSGVSTFNDIQFSAAGTVTMSATSGALSGTATAITITDSAPPAVVTVAVAGTPPQLRQLREARGRVGIL